VSWCDWSDVEIAAIAELGMASGAVMTAVVNYGIFAVGT
jgi:hypothetical protein